MVRDVLTKEQLTAGCAPRRCQLASSRACPCDPRYSPSVASRREQRIAENETLFRAANERMADWEERDRVEAADLYFCECADPQCNEKVRLRGPDYERVRSDPCHFFVVSGHETPDVETVIESREGWVLVEKDPGVREIVEATDPRTD